MTTLPLFDLRLIFIENSYIEIIAKPIIVYHIYIVYTSQDMCGTDCEK